VHFPGDKANGKLMKNKNQTPQESLVRIFVNGEFFSSLLCTPRDVRELTVGWMFSQGHIESINEIAALGACEDMQDIHIQLSNGGYKERDRTQIIKTSACMGGEISYKQFFKDTPKLRRGPQVSLEDVRSLMKKTLSMTPSYKETGGIHCASLASVMDKQVIACFEDIGRHNAVDKMIGRMLLTGLAPEDKLLLTSGRISSEMVLKAAHSRIPIIATITTSTDLAVRIAEEADLTLVGRALSRSPIVWCGRKRILDE
jgi:FdhD protein